MNFHQKTHKKNSWALMGQLPFIFFMITYLLKYVFTKKKFNIIFCSILYLDIRAGLQQFFCLGTTLTHKGLGLQRHATMQQIN